MDGSVAYSDVPEGFQVKSAPASQSYSDLPEGFSVKSTEDQPRSFGESLVSRAGEGWKNLTSPLGDRKSTTPEKGESAGQFVMRAARQNIPAGIEAPLKMMGGVGQILSSPAGATGESLERKAGQAAGLSGAPLEKAARDTGDLTQLIPIFPGIKPAISAASKAGEIGTGIASKIAKSPTTEALLKDRSSNRDTVLQSGGKIIESATKVGGSVLKGAAKPVVRKILDSDNPMIGGGLKRDLASPEAQKARELGKRVGVNFSAAEQTGNEMARGIEDTLANSPKYSSQFAGANEQKTTAVVNKFKETLASISPNETDVAGLGDRLTKAYKGTIDSLVNTRRAQAEVDFTAAREATGGAPVVVPENFIGVLNKYIKEGASPTATKEQIATAAKAKKALANLTEQPAKPSTILDATGQPIARPVTPQYKKITVNDLQNGLHGYGDAAESSSSITGGLKTASDRRFDKEALHAFEADLDKAADSGVGAGAQALKVARDNYRSTSQKIGDIQQTALGKIVGGAERDSQGNLVLFPEKIADRFLSMQPTEIKATLKFLDQEHPDVAKMARRYTLEAAYKKASGGVGQAAAGGVKDFNMKQFVEGLPNDEKLTAILGSHKAVAEVHDVSEALNRLRWYGGRKGGSPTFGRTEILNGFKGWGAKKLYQSALDDTLAEDMLNPQKRAELAAEANRINGKATADQALGAETDPLMIGARK